MIRVHHKQVQSLLTKSSLPGADYVVNPYIGCPHKCIYCYAEFMKRFTSHTGEVWGDFIDIKEPVKAISHRKIAGKKVLISSVTDPYNGYEKRFAATRKVLEELSGSEAQVEILTKSSLVLRDIDLLKKIPNVKVGISLNTLDDDFRKKIEIRAASVGKRLEALAVLKEEGIGSYLFVSPMFPGLTEFEKLYNTTCGYVDDYLFENLNLRAAYKKRVLQLIDSSYPGLTPLYRDIFSQKKHPYWIELAKKIETFFAGQPAKCTIYFFHEKIKK